jgi:hypothetical protein
MPRLCAILAAIAVLGAARLPADEPGPTAAVPPR